MDEMWITLFNLMSNWQGAQQKKAKSHHTKNSTPLTVFLKQSQYQPITMNYKDYHHDKKKSHWKRQNLKG